MQLLTNLPTPSKHHSTCAWCTQAFGGIVELIDHVDTAHVPQPRGR